MDRTFLEQLKHDRDESTKEWYAQIKKFEPVLERNYDWIWEYAKFRFDWSMEKTRYVEEKGTALLKLVFAITAALWVVFGGVLRSTDHISIFTLLLIAVGGFCLILSGRYALRASGPAEHVYPKSEEDAIGYANYYHEQTAALGNFCLQLADSTEQERFVTMEKGYYVIRGTRYACNAVLFFTLALLCEVCHRTGQFSALWGLVRGAAAFVYHLSVRVG